MPPSVTSTMPATAPSAPAATKATPGIAQNFEAFLLLLTTQLKNQSPLDPLDTNQFTQQLVQFAAVEQQMRGNASLSGILDSTKAANASLSANFVGKLVSADGASSRLKNGAAQWVLNPARDATQATITISNQAGGAVATITKPLTNGPQTFVWDGTLSTGGKAPDGAYTISVTARDAAGQTVRVNTEVVGNVDGVDLSGDAPVLHVGAAQVPLKNVKMIIDPALRPAGGA